MQNTKKEERNEDKMSLIGVNSVDKYTSPRKASL